MDRAELVHENFLRRLADGELPAPRKPALNAGPRPDKAELTGLFLAQLQSRHLDRHARKLQARGQGFYTIGSSGHEGNAAIAAALRHTDPAFLHYRDAAFLIARAAQLPGQTPVQDMLLSFTSSSEDPVSGGRHKVLGSKALNIPPQTSTIASHLPKAVGAAFSLGLSRHIHPPHQEWLPDSIVYCSFGDASLNHSTAQGALNTASWTSYRQAPLPLLFVCEDNGIGISTKTPAGWIEASAGNRPGLRYAYCDGLDILDTWTTAVELAGWIRQRRKPAFLHMGCVRLYGHAGADAQTAYMSLDEIEAAEANDPLLHTARHLIEQAGLSKQDILDLYTRTDAEVAALAEEAVLRPKLQNAAEVMASIVPAPRPPTPGNRPSTQTREAVFGTAELRALAQPQHMAKLINFALTDLLLSHPEIVMAGEDIGQKGGVYGVTQRLHARFGARRIIDTLLDEQSILGLAIGLAQNGFLPIPEIQFLAYLHNAEDQIRGEAATLPFFSNRQYVNPMVLRIAGLGYQRGFGGHFHNDNSLAVLRDIPGLIIACPSNGHDAALMLREAVRLARDECRIVVFLEPIALYMTRDLFEEGDGLWTHVYPPPDQGETLGLNDIGVYGGGKTLAIVSYGNGYYLSRKAEKVLREKHQLDCRIIDIRWLAPLPADALLDAVADCRSVLIVDECRQTGSQSEALMTLFAERSRQATARLTAEDSFIATGPAFDATLPSVDGIVA
ncbi:MAG: MFS transporter, partial [Gammaproteobacteria bacterium]|nr:MFS transporter [Gammaproteobacteria bacterium]